MFIRTFIVFFCINIVSFMLSVWTRLNGWYLATAFLLYLPIIAVSIYWPIYLKSILTESFIFKNIVYNATSAVSAIILADTLVFMFWSFVIMHGFSGLNGEDYEMAEIILYAHVGTLVLFGLISFTALRLYENYFANKL